ncbi:MAG: SpoIIE family protein phosphatase [Crocinitomicaceae bacterium]
MLKSIFTGFLLITSIFVLSQSFYPPIDNFTSRDYGKDQIPENLDIVQDHRGVIYVGNSGVVLEYDGSNWRKIPVISGTIVRALAVDENGMVYVGTTGDFGRLVPNNKGELVYESLIDSSFAAQYPFADIWRISNVNEKIYFQAYELVFVYDTKSKQLSTIETKTTYHTSFACDGRFYLRERETGLGYYENDEFHLLKNGEIFKDLGVFGMVKDKASDTIMIITQEVGLWKLIHNEIIPFECVNNDFLSQQLVMGAERLEDNNIAINTFLSGVYIIDFQGNILKKINKRTGLRVNAVNAVFEDRDNNIWLALSNGISKVNYNSPLSFYNEKAGLMGGVMSVVRFNNRIYVGTNNGLFVQNIGDTEKTEFEKIGAILDPVWDIKQVGSDLWIATEHEVLIMDGNENFRRKNYNSTNKIFFDESNGIVITGGPNGVYIFDVVTGMELTRIDGPMYTVSNIVKNPSTEKGVHEYWLSSINYSVIKIVYSNGQFSFSGYNSMDGLEVNFIAKPMIFNNRVVFGTGSGLLCFISEEEVRKELPDSLKDDPDFVKGYFDVFPLFDSTYTQSSIFNLKEGKSRTWVVIEGQIGYFENSTGKYIKKPFWGIDYGRINELYLEEDGTLWICAADGLIRFKENERKIYDSKFNTILRSVSMTGDSLIFMGSFMADNGLFVSSEQTGDPVIIEYKFNSMKFTFAAPYFEDNHRLTYQYMLEGYDLSWSNWGVNTEAVYTNLHEGDYVFKVRAKNVYGTISEIAEYRFTINPPWYRTYWAYTLFGVLLILLILIIVRISMARLKAKNAWLEGVVAERTKEIADKNIVLEHQKDEILHQKMEIEDSINYAKRIQTAILPLEKNIKLNLPESFVLFKPKDIVSGDFYWFAKQDDKLIFICADCTGHGVPGAFMSMIGSDKLNTAVLERGVVMPDSILSELNVGIKRTLKQEGDKESTKDGMDASIVTIDLAKRKLYYAGANRPLWVVKNGNIEEIKATKVAVAGFTPDDQVFEMHEFDIFPGDLFYMSSDGYADQFGGDKGKKLKVKAMKEIILENMDLPMEEQKQVLDDQIMDWMKGYEQVDDICVIGIKIT